MSTSGLVDWKWMSQGDFLLDGTGDIATTNPATLESVVDMVRSRLKAAIDGWKLYAIGADLNARLGDTVSAELELTLKRQVQQSLSNQFLPAGSFQVQSLVDGGKITLFVYLNKTLIAQTTVNTQVAAVAFNSN